MRRGVVRGMVGRIMWSYYAAASVTEITVTRTTPHADCLCGACEAGRWTMRATLVLSDAFKLSRKPLVFVIPTEKGNMTWPITDLEIQDRFVAAELGRPL